MTGLDRVRELAGRESGLAVVFVSRSDGSGSASVVNAGVLDHPITFEPAVGFVARGGARKLAYLRARPRVTIVFRSDWEWVAVEGDAQLIGPQDSFAELEPGDVASLLRAVYAAAVGGTQADWAELDSVMAAEGQTAVLFRPYRGHSNPGP